MTEEEKIEVCPKPKLDKKVLLSVFIGIAAVFFVMILINSFIFKIVSGQKAAFYLSVLASNTLFIVLIFIIKTNKKLTWNDLGWKRVNFFAGLKRVLIIWAITWFIDLVYLLIINYLGIAPQGNELVQLLQKPTFLILLANVSLIAIIAPFIEETLFRGLLFGSLRTYCGTWMAITISAVIFSALHFDLLGFVPRFVLGMGLGYLYVKHNSIFPSVGLHGLNNLLAVIMISTVT